MAVAKLILTFKGAKLEEIPITKSQTTIGREPNNDIVINNQAISRHHVKISWDKSRYIVEDLNSVNGTFVNENKVARDILRHKDEILVGKHILVFVNEEKLPTEKGEDRATSAMEKTFILPKNRPELMALRTGKKPAMAEKPSEVEGNIAIISGGVDQESIKLTKRTTVGGKSRMADIKLRGFFVGNPAFIISKQPEGFSITHSEGKRMTRVNSEVIEGQRELKNGDIITVGATKMQFYSKKQSEH
jgi:pSer/pThr/pTyr-binding forkhead associated (FHA) protein